MLNFSQVLASSLACSEQRHTMRLLDGADMNTKSSEQLFLHTSHFFSTSLLNLIIIYHSLFLIKKEVSFMKL